MDPFKHPPTSLLSNRKGKSCSAEVPSKQESLTVHWAGKLTLLYLQISKGKLSSASQVSSARDICKGQASGLTSVNFLEGTKSALTIWCHGELPLLKLFLYLSASSSSVVLSNRIPLLRTGAQSGQLHFWKGMITLNRQVMLLCPAEICQGQCRNSGSSKPIPS